MLTTEFDINIAKKVWREEGIEVGRKEGRKKGRKEGQALERAKIFALLESGRTIEEIKELLKSGIKQ